ncbi:LLM class oxidoreductase [Psychrosphaera algicola]|uniref:LLM class oxidoreductase n=1 Tax=Psychrosphaera algicola TaxID=3023714 RepID=A0ABT5FAW4_9GAMM|nr:LLM class oxidoreductase [Psychrosphaera sp. G1-22]MDC2887720.1 LLM class oxidoreductase [Psychrosphaera sp. G1-22]
MDQNMQQNMQTTKKTQGTQDTVQTNCFPSLNSGYNSVFKLGKLSIGLVVPLERYESGPVPTMEDHLTRVQLAERLGFKSVWLRDVPFNVPAFGDAGHVFDPFVYLGYLAAQTKTIALGVASIVLPLRHPAHVAKSAASVDVLSNGRVILGVASGDRPQEYPAMELEYENRGERFRDSFEYIRKMQNDKPTFDNRYGKFDHDSDIDMLPKSTNGRLPLLVTGGSQQSPEWIAKNSDGCMVYPHDPLVQKLFVEDWYNRLKRYNRAPQPVMQPLYFDLATSNSAKPEPIHLGFRSTVEYLVGYLKSLERAGISHVALNLRFNQLDIETTLNLLAEKVLTEFS